MVDDVRVMRRHRDRRYPLEPVLQLLRVVPVHVRRADVELFLLTGADVEAAEPTLAAGVDDVGIARLGDCRAGLPASVCQNKSATGSIVVRGQRPMGHWHGADIFPRHSRVL